MKRRQLAATLAIPLALSLTFGAAPAAAAEKPPDRLIEVEVHGGYGLDTGTEVTAGQRVTVTGPRSGTSDNLTTRQPPGGSTESSSKADESFTRVDSGKGNDARSNTTGTATSTTSNTGKTTIKRFSNQLGFDTGFAFGGSARLWLSPHFALRGAYDMQLGSARVELGEGTAKGVGVPAPATSLALSETSQITTTVASPSTATSGVGPNSQKGEATAKEERTTVVWTWNTPGAVAAAFAFGGGAPTITTDNGIPVQVFKERLNSAAATSVTATPSAGAFPNNASNLSGSRTEKPTSLDPGPIQKAAAFLGVRSGGGAGSFAGLTYTPSFSSTSGIRGTSGATTGGTTFVYNSADNASGVASGSTAPSTSLSSQFTNETSGGGIQLITLEKLELRPTEATDSTSANTAPKVTYTGTGKVFASTSRDVTFSLFSLMGQFVTWASENAELWLGAGVAVPSLSSKGVTIVTLAGDGGTGSAHQSVKFEQKDPDATNNATDRVVLFTEETDIEATETTTSEGSALLAGPMLGIGGRVAFLGFMHGYASLGYSPVLAGRLSSFTRMDIKGHRKSVFKTTTKTFTGTSSTAQTTATLTDERTTEQTIDSTTTQDKDSAPDQTMFMGGSAAEAVLGLGMALGPVQVGAEIRDQIVSQVAPLLQGQVNHVSAQVKAGFLF